MKEGKKFTEKRAGEFIINNFLRIIIYVAVLFVFIPGYTAAIWVYLITMHVMAIAMLSMLYDKKAITEKALSYKELIFMFVEGIALASIMLAKGYLYSSFITVIYSLIVLIEIKEFKNYRIKKSQEKT